jgi:hypothetical protein
MSTFKVAGVSKQHGEFKVRFANDMLRVKVLEKNAHKDIDLMELPTPMTKEAALTYLLSINFDNGNTAVRAALEAGLESRTATAVAKPAAKGVMKKAKKSPSLDAIAARAKATKKNTVADAVVAEAKAKAKVDAALEDAPF